MNEFEATLKKDVEKYLKYLREYKSYNEKKIKEILEELENIRKTYIVENNIKEGDFESNRSYVAAMLYNKNDTCKKYSEMCDAIQKATFFQIKSKKQKDYFLSYLTPCYHNYDIDEGQGNSIEGYYVDYIELPRLFHLITAGTMFAHAEWDSFGENPIFEEEFKQIKIEKRKNLYNEEELPGITKMLLSSDNFLKYVIDGIPRGARVGLECFNDTEIDLLDSWFDFDNEENDENIQENKFDSINNDFVLDEETKEAIKEEIKEIHDAEWGDISIEDCEPNYEDEAEEWFYYIINEEVMLFILDKLSEEKNYSLPELAIEVVRNYDSKNEWLRRLYSLKRTYLLSDGEIWMLEKQKQ